MRTMPDDVDFELLPCELCVRAHISGSKTPWPYWKQRTAAQFKADADAGHKVKVSYEED
jgi:hypothetical protein